MLIIGRAVAGMGGSGLMNGGLTIIAASAPIHKRPGNSPLFSHEKFLTNRLALLGIMMARKSSRL
jgi:MFS family permease